MKMLTQRQMLPELRHDLFGVNENRKFYTVSLGQLYGLMKVLMSFTVMDCRIGYMGLSRPMHTLPASGEVSDRQIRDEDQTVALRYRLDDGGSLPQ